MSYTSLFIGLLFFSMSFAQSPYSNIYPGTLVESKKTFWRQIYADIDSGRTVIFNKTTLHVYAIVKNDRVDTSKDSIARTVPKPGTIMIKKGRKEFIHEAILRASAFQFVVDSLKAHNLHPDLRWLPVLESGYIDTMISEQNAHGIWQFIPPTAKKYGLSIEEISDPCKSTSAFVRYMSSLHRQFGDYSLALTAYHHGENGIREKLKRKNAISLEAIIPSLGFQSANYYARYLAIVDIARSMKGEE